VARKKRFNLAGVTQLVVQSSPGADRFLQDSGDHQHFRHCLECASMRSETLVHAYSLAASKVAFLVTPTRTGGVSLIMQSLGRRYANHFYSKYHGQRVPWRPRYIAFPVEPGCLTLASYAYIENLPVSDGLARSESLYPWSSFHANTTGNIPSWITPHPEIEKLGDNPAIRARVYSDRFDDLVRQLRAPVESAIACNAALGSPGFITQLEQICQFRLTPGKPGRPKVV